MRAARQRLRLDSTVLLGDERTLASLGVADGATISLKDLGPQVGWKTVFLLEYAGPLAIHQVLLARHLGSLSFTQLMAYACVTLHYAKREYETLFVHRFSHATMPLRNLFKNSAHYWLVGGAWVGWELYQPAARADTAAEQARALRWALLFLLAELGNLYSHVILRRLRARDARARGIPHGFLFDYVSCPNYLCEAAAWFAFAAMTRLASAWVFAVLATAQMYLWARKKHAVYRREFAHYPRSRTAMFPFLL